MGLQDDLRAIGIELRSYATGDHYTTCPSCSPGRKPANRKLKCLGVTIMPDGHAVYRCNHCGDEAGGFKGAVKGDSNTRPIASTAMKREYVRPRPPPPPKRSSKMLEWFAGRAIPEEVVEEFGIYVKVGQWFPQLNEGEGAEAHAIAFPYRRAGELINHKYRQWGVKNFAQDKGAEQSLYNVDGLVDNDEGIFAEGEMDVLSWHAGGLRNSVTVPNGAPQKAKEEMDPDDKRYLAIANDWERIQHIKKWYIATDGDAAGEAHAEEIARRLGKEKCWRVHYPEGTKDANEVLLKYGREMLLRMLETARPWPIEGLHKVEPGTLSRLRTTPRKRLYSTGMPSVDSLFKIVLGQVTVIIGFPGSGKSEWADMILVNLAKTYGLKAAICSPENPIEEHVSKLAEKYLGLPFRETGDMVLRPMSEEAMRQAEEWINQHFVFIRQDDDSKDLTSEFILEKAKLAVVRDGVNVLVVDPWNEIYDDFNGNETEWVRRTFIKFIRFAKNHDVHLFIVVHPPKLPRDKNGQRPIPGLYDAAGSAHWVNKTDNGITVHRPKRQDTAVDIIVSKVRWRWVGQPGKVTINWERTTGTYIDTKGG